MQDFAASRLAEAEQAARSYRGDVAALEPVAQDELFRRLGGGQVLVLDVLLELRDRISGLPAGTRPA